MAVSLIYIYTVFIANILASKHTRSRFTHYFYYIIIINNIIIIIIIFIIMAVVLWSIIITRSTYPHHARDIPA